MPLIVLGTLVVIGLVVYMFFTGELGSLFPSSGRSARNSGDPSDIPKVIVLPSDLEKEKKKRNVKTGKDS